MRYIMLIVLALALSACGGSQVTNSPSTSAPSISPSTPRGSPSPAAASSGYPQEAADRTLCNTYQNLIQAGDLEAIPAVVTGADGSVSKVLAADMLGVVYENGTVQQDEQTLIHVAIDCAIAQAGRQPVELS